MVIINYSSNFNDCLLLEFYSTTSCCICELQQNYKYKLILIPLDTRPPCQKMVVDAGKMAGVQIITPPSEIMDYYTKEGDTKNTKMADG